MKTKTRRQNNTRKTKTTTTEPNSSTAQASYVRDLAVIASERCVSALSNRRPEQTIELNLYEKSIQPPHRRIQRRAHAMVLLLLLWLCAITRHVSIPYVTTERITWIEKVCAPHSIFRFGLIHTRTNDRTEPKTDHSGKKVASVWKPILFQRH